MGVLWFQADIINIKLEGFIGNGTLFTSKVANIPSSGSQNQIQEQNQQPKSPSPAGRKQVETFLLQFKRACCKKMRHKWMIHVCEEQTGTPVGWILFMFVLEHSRKSF